MALIPGKEEELDQNVEPQRPLFERVQDLIFRLDVGYGVQWFRVGLFCLLVLLVVLLYTGTQFYGLRDREAMEVGQLARNLARGRGYVTQCVRPVDLWYLNSIGRPALGTGQNAIPELWTPPVYPWAVSVILRGLKPQVDLTEKTKQLELPPGQLPVLGDAQSPRKLAELFDAGRDQTLRMDRLLVVVAWICFLAAMVLLYLLARELFDHRVAVLSVFLYLFCDPLLNACTAGLPTAFLAMLFMVVVCGVFKAEKWTEAGKPAGWIYGALAVAALGVGLGTLTQYAFVSVLLPLLVYVSVSFRNRQPVKKAGLCLAIFLVVLMPWMVRNWRVSQTLFGLAHLELSEGVRVSYTQEIKPGQLQRVYAMGTRTRYAPIIKKLLVNSRQLYETTLKDTGGNYLIAFFLASLLHRFRRDEVFRLRRLLFWTLLSCVVWSALIGPPKHNPLTMFMPLIIIYACAFFFVLFERLQFRRRWERRAMVGLFALLNMLPVAFTILPPVTTSPYPPYDGGVVSLMGVAFRENEVVASDIPWAVAWYADRTAVWTPLERDDFLAINDNTPGGIAGVYLTQATQGMSLADAWSGYQAFWVPLFNLQAPLPAGFPLQFRRPMTPDGMQVLLSNRPR